jgi:hypothetical protein
MERTTHNRPRRLVTLAGAIVLSLGLAACGDESTGPEAGADVEALVGDAVAGVEEDVAALDERITALEGAEAVGAEDPELAPIGAADLAANPDQYVGQEVTVSGTVSSITGDNAFTIGGGDIGGDALLVTSATSVGQQQLVEQGAIVQVTGTVAEQFSADAVADDLGIEWEDPEAFADFAGQNYLIAESVSEATEMTEQG